VQSVIWSTVNTDLKILVGVEFESLLVPSISGLIKSICDFKLVRWPKSTS